MMTSDNDTCRVNNNSNSAYCSSLVKNDEARSCALERYSKWKWIQEILKQQQLYDNINNNDEKPATSFSATKVKKHIFYNEHNDRFVLRSLYPIEIDALNQRQCHSYHHNDSNSNSKKTSSTNDYNSNNENDWTQVRLLFMARSTVNSSSLFVDEYSNHNNSSNDDDDDDRCEQLLLSKLISNVTFHGNVVFLIKERNNNPSHQQNGSSSSSNHETKTDHNQRMVRMGLHNCRYVSNCIIDIMNVSILDCSFIEYCYMDELCSIRNCGTITNSTNSTVSSNNKNENNWISNNLDNKCQKIITVGAETAGGYHLIVTPESTMIDIGKQIINYDGADADDANDTDDANDGNANDDMSNGTTNIKNRLKSFCYNVFSFHCSVWDTPYIDTVYMYSNSSIVRSTEIVDVILYPQSKISNNCIVYNTSLQWDCVICNNSTITNTFLMEQSHTGPNSVLTNTILGPDVHVSCGEIHNSIIGPNTNSHHQSLLISVIWLTGRGNVGYGSNVGSNHTGRLPDQIVSSGEGIFWGLSCTVTMPVDVSCSYYTLIAAGTKLPSGRCTMPFSLVLNSTATNAVEVIPGWVIKSSPYTIERNEIKYSTRRKAKCHLYYTGYAIYRMQTIHQCFLARKELLSLLLQRNQHKKQTQPSEYSVGNTIGTPVTTTTYHISDQSCDAGISTYTNCIRRYALLGLYETLLGMVLLHPASTGSNIPSCSGGNSSTYTKLHHFHGNNDFGADSNGTNELIEAHRRRHDLISLVSSMLPPSSSSSQCNDDPNENKEEQIYNAMCFHQQHDSTSNTSTNANRPCWPVLPWEIDRDEDEAEKWAWRYQIWLLRHEFEHALREIVLRDNAKSGLVPSSLITNPVLVLNVVHELLVNQLVRLQLDYISRVVSSKRRDDSRGIQTVPGYEKSHSMATPDDDQTIHTVHHRCIEIQNNVHSILQSTAALLSIPNEPISLLPTTQPNVSSKL